MEEQTRLKARRLSIRSRAYLVYRALWPKLGDAIRVTLEKSPTHRLSVLDIGCGERPYADLFGEVDYIGLNYGMDGASPDVVGDAQSLPIASSVIDIVFSTQVIEHLPSPSKMLQEARRVLRPGGRLILSGPFYWPLHEEPYDFYRFTKYGFEHLLTDAGFAEIVVEGDCSAVTQVAVSLIEVLPRALAPLIPLINLITPALERRSRNFKSTLNYVVRARKP